MKPRELPIIFTAESVRAILAGAKTQTRRTMKTQPSGRFPLDFDDESGEWYEDGGTWRCKPRFRVGDVLWVKEAWAAIGCERGSPGAFWGPDHNWSIEDNGPDDQWMRIEYRADCSPDEYGMWKLPGGALFDGPWRSPRHMPRWASRISLEVTEVRAQRVQEISEEDAVAEGFAGSAVGTPLEQFAAAWDSINGKRSPWSRNDFVFAYTFRRQA